MSKLYSSFVIGVDVNTIALEYVQKSGVLSDISLVRGDLTTWIRPATVDVVIFNPPYVPTEGDEMERALRDRDIAASWAGGERGREVIDQSLPGIRDCLVDGGVFYLVLERVNGVEEVRDLARKYGLGKSVVVGEVTAGRETLYVVRFTAVDLPANCDRE